MGKKSKKDESDVSTPGKKNADESQTENDVNESEEYDALCAFVNPIAQPLASRKLAKRLYRLIKKASAEKHFIRQGITDVQRAIRKKERGLVVLAGDVTPIDVYCHMPGVCEEEDMPYVYTPSRTHLGLAAGHKRPTIMMMIRCHDNYKDLFLECEKALKELPLPLNNG